MRLKRICTLRLAIVALCLSITSTASQHAQAQGSAPGVQSHAESTANSGVPGRFVDITERAGVHFKHQAPHTSRKYLIETMGSGVALFDCDNDGRLDLFLVNGAPYPDPTPKGFIPQK